MLKLTTPPISEASQVQRDIAQESREILSQKARSFRWGAQFLSSERHDDAALLYAFCRAVDDAADTAPSVEVAKESLDALTEQLLGQREPEPMMAAFLALMARCQMPASWPMELIIGVRQDLEPVRVSDDVELLRYCYRVAGVVGLMMCKVLAVEDPKAYPHAIDLGIGMQLTNICRDVAEDASMGRVYLPKTRLHYYGQQQSWLVEGCAKPEAVAAVVRDLLALAELYYTSARQGMRYIPKRERAAILIAADLYREIGLRLVRDRGGDALKGRMIVPWTRKSTRTIKALGKLVSPEVTGLWPGIAHDRQLHVALDGLPGTNLPQQ